MGSPVGYIVVDFETYYSDEYSLGRMSVEAYCRDPRFEIITAAVWRNAPDRLPAGCDAYHGTRDEIRRALAGEARRHPDAVWAAHNAWFDGYILECLLGVHPRMLLCTAALSNWTGHSRIAGRSLKALCRLIGLGRKGEDREAAKGMRLADFTPGGLERYEIYCRHDAFLAAQLLNSQLRDRRVTPEVLEMVDMSVRMYTRPLLELDRARLEAYRERLLAGQDADRERMRRLFDFPDRDSFLKALRGRDSFTAMLRRLGAEVPMKRSAARERAAGEAAAARDRFMARIAEGTFDPADKPALARALRAIREPVDVPALAKGDPGFMALASGPDPDVALLCRMRQGNNGNALLSRTETLLGIASRGPRLSVPLMPWASHTGRYTGALGSGESSDRVNLQNLPKRDGDLGLREAIRAPEGMVIVAGDSRQIEARVGAWVAGEERLLEGFRGGEDLYAGMAAEIEGIPAEEIAGGCAAGDPRYKAMRAVGKVTMLSSQYGIGPGLLALYFSRAGLALAPDAAGHRARAREIHALYNRRHARIAACRAECGRSLDRLASSPPGTVLRLGPAPGAALFRTGGGAGAVLLTSGFLLLYPNLRRAGDGYAYDLYEGGRQAERRLYGGLLFANLVQAYSFHILWLQGLAINRRWRVVSNVHDSWVAVCRGDEADAAAAGMLGILRAPPPWAAGVPLDAEVQVSGCYDIA
ncbi:MAG: hypothetical protein LBG06_04610 [Deltaproteobacteria bacterium]|nr:hypothetical protein [Deltaproteobacteria bacterium]